MSASSRLKPTGDDRPKARIVHLGLGAFFRAHVATYLSRLGEWGVIGVSLRSAGMRDRLAPQGFAYTAVTLDPVTRSAQQIEVVRDVLVAPENPQAVIEAMAHPDISIVSLTVTEKGYCHDPATGELNAEHPDIIHDAEHPLPRTAPGFIVRALHVRRAAGLQPFTVMSCDNLADNGSVTRAVVLKLAELIDPDLAGWIEEHGAFPASMVDRIVPATTDQNLQEVSVLINARDEAPVMHEPFCQWVLTDHFAQKDRPVLERVGVQVVPDVAPYEHMKLRMLNGAHSALAYLGALAGFQTVSEAVSDPAIAAYLRFLWHAEIASTVVAPPDIDLADYAVQLMERFSNPAIVHKTHQIAMDGSQKLPPRLLAPIAERLTKGQQAQGLVLAVAGWMQFVAGPGQDRDIQDPLAASLIAARSDSAETTVRALLAHRAIFPADLAERIETDVIRFYQQLSQNDPRVVMKGMVT